MKSIYQMMCWLFSKRRQNETADPLKTISKKSLSSIRRASKLKTIRLRHDNAFIRMCVYKIWFGNKFYIGSTTNIDNRLKVHLSSINACFDGKRVGKNSQTNIMNHLILNPGITEGIAEILEVCKTEYELVTEEKKHLGAVFLSPDCLNQVRHTTRRINGVLVRD